MSFLFALRKGGYAPARDDWLVHASQPQLPIPAMLSVPNVLIYNTREAPYVRHLRALKAKSDVDRTKPAGLRGMPGGLIDDRFGVYGPDCALGIGFLVLV